MLSITKSLVAKVATASTKSSLYRLSAYKIHTASTLLSNQNSRGQETASLILSDSCVKRLKELEIEKKNQFLRLSVDSGGCSGFEYKFSIDSQVNADDKIIEKDKCKVVVDEQSLGFIKGATVDYYEELIRAGFRIIANPNAEQGCSCGASFSIKF